MKMRTGRIAEHRAVEGAAPAMAMIRMIARIRKIPSTVRMGGGMISDSRMGMGKGW